MSKSEIEANREQRIATEIIAAAHDDAEQATNWYSYLEDKLNFPFKAKWRSEGRRSSPSEGAEVEVLGLAAEDDCGEDMFVEVLYRKGTAKDVFSVPLAALEIVTADGATTEAIADWNYWVGKGYEV